MGRRTLLPFTFIMIKFTDLRVQRGHLIITAEVREIEDYYDNVYISQIKIDSQDTFNSSGPSSSLIYESETFTSGTKKVTLDLQSSDLDNVDIDKTMFFVYAVAGGTPAADTPCGFDETPSVGVTFSLCPIYNETMQYVKEVENLCVLPKNFINMILQFKAIQYSINSGHFAQAITYYEKFYKNIGAGATSPCGCHG